MREAARSGVMDRGGEAEAGVTDDADDDDDKVEEEPDNPPSNRFTSLPTAPAPSPTAGTEAAVSGDEERDDDNETEPDVSFRRCGDGDGELCGDDEDRPPTLIGSARSNCELAPCPPTWSVTAAS